MLVAVATASTSRIWFDFILFLFQSPMFNFQMKSNNPRISSCLRLNWNVQCTCTHVLVHIQQQSHLNYNWLIHMWHVINSINEISCSCPLCDVWIHLPCIELHFEVCWAELCWNCAPFQSQLTFCQCPNK